jgi:hypothetical protein
LGGHSVWLLEATTGELRDINNATSETDGMTFDSPVLGVAAMHVEYEWPEVDNDGVHLRGRSVGVSLTSGQVVWMQESTGCLVQDVFGPRTTVSSQNYTSQDYETNFDNVGGGAFLEMNADASTHVQVANCAGIAQAETWTLRYDRNLQGWEATGSVTGLQQNIVYEDERYLTDKGEVSFVVRAGALPSEENWVVQFSVTAGVLSANGDNNNDLQFEVAFDYPSDPVFFQYRVGPYDGGWRPVDERPYLLVPLEGSDLVSRVKPQDAMVEVVWD